MTLLISFTPLDAWDANQSQGYPQYYFASTHYYKHLGGERHSDRKVSCLRTQHNDSGLGLNPDHLIHSPAH